MDRACSTHGEDGSSILILVGKFTGKRYERRSILGLLSIHERLITDRNEIELVD
jgi:hypothetical protein